MVLLSGTFMEKDPDRTEPAKGDGLATLRRDGFDR